MKALILPMQLRGTVVPPPSKSQAHRLIIAAALADGTSRISGVALSDDIRATLNGMQALGAEFTLSGKGTSVTVEIQGARADHALPLPEIDCGESGSTLRFLIPIALVLRGGAVFHGRGRLLQRPLDPYFDLFKDRGIRHELKKALVVQGTLEPGNFPLRGDVSSQFLTGFLYALPLLDGQSTVSLTTPLESRGYEDLTLDTLQQHGINVTNDNPASFVIPGGQAYRPCDGSVEKDYSQAAFFFAAQGMGNALSIKGLNPNSRQGDRVVRRLSARLCDPGETQIDVSQCPDLVPALAVQAALREGHKTRIVNAGRLRIKESDRLATVAGELNVIGASIEEHGDELIINGVTHFQGGDVDAHNDHRIAMMLGIAATRSRGPIFLTGAESVSKSYPDFWDEYKRLGGNVRLLADPVAEAIRV
ncbi:MAG: 3-phosphoshikimate 1-carboxyvinyltransferase [Alistipes sp.]|nr:3-phosphoshikimate 1-carboxyvinyltransferase [Alistipes sp.]